MCTHFEGGRGSEKVYVLYTHLNVDNYGWPLIQVIASYIVLFQHGLNHDSGSMTKEAAFDGISEYVPLTCLFSYCGVYHLDF